MRAVGKFFDIFIIGLLLTVVALLNTASKYTSNKIYITKILEKNNVYENINDEIKKQAKDNLTNKFNNIPNLDIDELVEETITKDIVVDAVNNILDELYNNERIYLDINILTKGYLSNMNKYLDKNKIELPNEVKEEINNIISENSINDVNESRGDSRFIDIFKSIRSNIKNYRILCIIILVILLVLTVIVSREKLRGIYKPFLFSGILLLILTNLTKVLFTHINFTKEEQKLTDLVDSVKNSIFYHLNMYSIAFIVIAITVGIVDSIIKCIINKNKYVENNI